MTGIPGQPAGGQPPAAPQAPVNPGAAMLTGQELNLRIRQGDPAYPPELWGKTLGEAMRYYSVMRHEFMQRNAPQPQQPQPQQPVYTQRAQQPQQPQGGYIPPTYGGYQGQPQQPAAPAFDMNQMSEMVQQAVTQALGPVAQVSAESVYQQVRTRFADWNQYDAEIRASVAGASPQQLLSPDLWVSAYYFAKGKMLSDPNRQQPQYAPQSQDPFAGRAQNGAIQTPPPPVFTEASVPMAPGSAGGPGSGPGEAYDPRDIEMARRFGITVDEYRAWKGGRVPPAPTQQNGNGMQGQPAPSVQYPAAQGWR